jgi:hypothetical protein
LLLPAALLDMFDFVTPNLAKPPAAPELNLPSCM